VLTSLYRNAFTKNELDKTQVLLSKKESREQKITFYSLASPFYKYLLASLMLNFASFDSYFWMNSLTQSGFTLLYSLKIQPIALLMKNSLVPKLLQMIFSKSSVFVFSLNFL